MIKIGDVISIKINSIKPYGAFGKAEDGSSCLLHISEISQNFVKNIDSYLAFNDIIKVVVIDKDETTNFLKVSLKQLPDEYLQEEKIKAKQKRFEDMQQGVDFKELEDNLPKWIKEEKEKIENESKSK